jgi:phosphohistidine phosphatase SixA
MSILLVVMRHAKSSWKSDAADDHDRPLNKRGRRDAPRVARALTERGYRPNLIISSDSRRTRETLDAMLPVLGDVTVAFRRAFYHAGIGEIRAELNEIEEWPGCVLVLGHNPGWDEAVEWLCGEAVYLRTANAALLKASGRRHAAALRKRESWELRDVIVARDLAAE